MLERIPACLTDRQQKALGARILWRRCKGMSDRKFDLWLAITAIRMQTYFDKEYA